ncbi:DUF440 family protein [Pseudaeromonas sharmana]|uniref:DUF440 family protein n=1 Tax=Pseudaeromonas sharmana TaxID=328412 RepID=A0ABV8CNA7_9GAMM
MSATLSPDTLIELGYELFLKHAADHLPPEAIVDITLEFEQRGAVDAIEPAADWVDFNAEQWSKDAWYEILIGLLNHQDDFEIIYCRILMPKDGNTAHAQLRWMEQDIH